jgi:hypothetical protein
VVKIIDFPLVMSGTTSEVLKSYKMKEFRNIELKSNNNGFE